MSVQIQAPIAAEHFADVPITIEVVLGTPHLSLRQISELKPGSIIRTERPAGGLVDLRVNTVLLASGEVIAVEDRLGIRVTGLQLED